MGLLSPDQLTLMQNAAAQTRTTPCSIQRKTATPDGMGGQSDRWTEIAAVLCFIAPAQAGPGTPEAIAQERLEQQSRFAIRLPAGQDITIRDRIQAAGTTYEVADVAGPRTIEISRLVYAVVVTS